MKLLNDFIGGRGGSRVHGLCCGMGDISLGS
jgi:hypothetical protein